MQKQLIAAIFVIVWAGPGFCQTEAGDTADPPGADEVVDELYRDLSAFMLPPPAVTVRDMQHLAIAMQIRDYCMNSGVPESFVRGRLERFSQLTGRTENCFTLLDY